MEHVAPVLVEEAHGLLDRRKLIKAHSREIAKLVKESSTGEVDEDEVARSIMDSIDDYVGRDFLEAEELIERR